ncbi:hypothetical protein EXIGLDRAFT_729375 [Exidia glandulosa HHB12029]|uniref:Fungal N-terminal domain-containing protein n=1 Tax=Exidia glandulosa HHB12029 TaxID=1314781 RepID=A0A165CL98_EXIGL|nr:hypothetical protein EXIGLDRAFT_729375 [Exidia glandulosa HHB12029]
MPIAAFTFGSFGDIATILQLAWTIRRALSESAGGASTQVRTLIVDIDAFTRALQQIKSALDTSASVPADLMNGIAHALESCFVLLRGVQVQIKSFNARMTGAVGARTLKRYWAALGWEILGGRSKVEAMRGRLSEQVEVIQTLLAAAQSQDLEELRKSAAIQSRSLEDARKDAETAHRDIGDMFASMRNMCVRLSATSAPFAFFDASRGQVLPIGVVPWLSGLPVCWTECGRFCFASQQSFNNCIIPNARQGLVYARGAFRYDSSEKNNRQWSPENPDPYIYKQMVLGQPRAGQHISLEVLFFLYCGGDDENVVVFVSPVYAVCVGESTSRAVVVPKASAALSGLLRCADQSELMRTGTFGLQDLLNEMVDPEDVRRLLKLY